MDSIFIARLLWGACRDADRIGKAFSSIVSIEQSLDFDRRSLPERGRPMPLK